VAVVLNTMVIGTVDGGRPLAAGDACWGLLKKSLPLFPKEISYFVIS
jgi:hypothetical protein